MAGAGRKLVLNSVLGGGQRKEGGSRDTLTASPGGIGSFQTAAGPGALASAVGGALGNGGGRAGSGKEGPCA